MFVVVISGGLLPIDDDDGDDDVVVVVAAAVAAAALRSECWLIVKPSHYQFAREKKYVGPISSHPLNTFSDCKGM